MTNASKAQAARRGATTAPKTNWHVPPILVPILLSIMIAAHAVYLVIG